MKAGTQGRVKRVKEGMGERETLIMIQGQGEGGRGSSRPYPTKPLVRSSIGSPLCAPSSQPVRHADRLLCLSVQEQHAAS